MLCLTLPYISSARDMTSVLLSEFASGELVGEKKTKKIKNKNKSSKLKPTAVSSGGNNIVE